MNPRRYFLPILCVLLCNPAQAQPEKPVFAQVTPADHAYHEFPDDPDAEAVLLEEWIEVSVKMAGTIMEIHRRIKILSEDGYSYADWQVPYFGNRSETLPELRAAIIQPDGSVRDVRAEEFLEESGDDARKAVVWSFPRVQVGSILDVRYRFVFRGENDLPSFSFYREIPARRSVLLLRGQRKVTYEAVLKATSHEWDTTEEGAVVYRLSHAPEKAHDPTLFEIGRKNTYFVMENMKAIDDVPFLSSVTNYAPSVVFNKRAVKNMMSTVTSQIFSWSSIIQIFSTHSMFGEQYTKGKNFNYIIKQAMNALPDPGSTSEREMILAAYHWVNERIEWNGEYNLTTGTSIKTAFKAGRGNSAAITLTLNAILRALKIDTKPVLVRGRENGFLYPGLPKIAQFDHVVLMVLPDDGEELWLDPGLDHLPAGMLRPEVQNYYGLPIGFVFQLTELGEFPARSDITLDTRIEDGQLAGTWQGEYLGNYGFSQRTWYFSGDNGEADEEQYVDAMYRERFTEAEIDNFQIENQDRPDEPLRESFDIVFGDKVNDAGDLMYVTPVIGEQWHKNPFDQENRFAPVEFLNPYTDLNRFILAIPEGYELETLPANVEFDLDEARSLSFRRTAELQDGKLTLTYQYDQPTTVIPVEKYADLRVFIDRLIEAQNEIIVLKKIISDED